MSPDGQRVEPIVETPFIDGAFVSSACDERAEVINPSNGQRSSTIPSGCDADVDRAALAARRAFDDGRWSDTPPSFKKSVLQRFADLIASDAVALDTLDAGDMGKPVSEGACSAATAAGLVRYCAESVDKLTGEVCVSDQHSLVTQRLVPRGVVGAVVPWNFPTYIAVLKLAPALAAGNCVVLKPSELSSRSAIRLAALGTEAGLPPGVLNVVLGLGQSVGRALGLHPAVDMLTFTGSTSVGKRMLEYAGQSNMKVVKAECGGKSPQIVFDDGVDLEAASAAIAQSLLTNQGQICSLGSRLLVQRSIEQPMLERISERIRHVVIGDALDRKTTFGPIASARQCARVMEYIQSAQNDGAELVSGGSRVLTQSGGYFVEPTLFRRVSPRARIAQEEIFGPVLSIMTFDDEADALRIANNTMYGLMAYVWTGRLATAMRVAKGIRSGVVVNAAAPRGEGPGYGFSFEPAGQSGIGIEGGSAGMESYSRRQLVWFNHD